MLQYRPQIYVAGSHLPVGLWVAMLQQLQHHVVLVLQRQQSVGVVRSSSSNQGAVPVCSPKGFYLQTLRPSHHARRHNTESFGDLH